MNMRYLIIGAIVCLALIGTASAQNTLDVSAKLNPSITIDVSKQPAFPVTWTLIRGANAILPENGIKFVTDTDTDFKVVMSGTHDGHLYDTAKSRQFTAPLQIESKDVTGTGTDLYSFTGTGGAVHTSGISQFVGATGEDHPGDYAITLTFTAQAV